MATSLAAQETLPPGIWTNTEDVYFAETEGRDKAEWIGLQVNETRQWRKIDAFGEPLSDFSDEPIPDLAKRSAGSGWQIGQSELRRANPFSCWVSVRKSTDKDDGSPEWTFASRLQTFDQGGRIFVGGNAEAPDVTLRLRNVTWAKGSRNKPALVLYVHRDDPERAESYSWASPDASLVGINLRWVQGSCAKAEDDPPWGEAGRARLIEMGEKWRAHYEAGEWGLLKALYADDAVLMTHGTKPLSGRNQIITFLQRLSDNGATVRFRFEPEEARVKGALGIVTAKYRMDIAFPDRAENQIAGRSLLIYKWNDGDWRLWRDIDNFAPDVTPESFDR
ncbi:MAG: nuclear transport factor 2 family protein [Pseudomonadota bacterium]